jgi:tRNA (guanine-N7-)-methyltransferase
VPRKKPNAGLIGGSLERRLEHSRVPPLDLPFVLAPVRREIDQARLRDFQEQAELHVEIGFGRPHYLCEFAAANPEKGLLGFEIKRRWCRAAAGRFQREGITNARIIEGDARAYLEQWKEDGCVSGFHILFPDPWWKKRHHKRRLFSEDFLALVTRLLVPGGGIVFRTDVAPYAEQVQEVVELHGGFRCVAVPVSPDEPRSHREKKCASLSIPVFSYRFTKEGSP